MSIIFFLKTHGRPHPIDGRLSPDDGIQRRPKRKRVYKIERDERQIVARASGLGAFAKQLYTVRREKIQRDETEEMLLIAILFEDI